MVLFIRRSTLLLIGILFLSALMAVIGIRWAHIIKTNASKQTLRRIIVVDAGHGDFDGGAESPNGVLEKDLNLVIAADVKERLEQAGYTVIMTRQGDEGIYDPTFEDIKQKKKSDMEYRRKVMNSSHADIFVSIHMNMFSDPSCSGPQVFYSGNLDESERLAELIQEKLCELSPEKREIKKAGDGIYLLKTAEIPAVLVECGFLSNPLEEAKLCTEQYQNRIADAIAEGIDAYYSERE